MIGYVDVDDLLDFGITLDILKKPLLRFRQSKSSSWENRKDPSDKRKVLIKYDTIPQSTIRKYNMPETYLEYFRIQNAKEFTFKKCNDVFELHEDSPEILVIKKALEIDYREHVDYYRKLIAKTHCKPNKVNSKAENSAKRHVLYLLFIQNTGGISATIKGSVKRQFEVISFFKMYNLIPERFSNYIHFSRKIARYKKVLQNGDSLYHEIVKESNFLKKKTVTDEFHKGILLFYATNPKHYSARQLAEFVNYHATLENKMNISRSWVVNQMNDPFDNTFRVLVDSSRMGAKYTNDNILPYLSRHASMHPHNTWFIDGTPIQMYYKDSSGNARRLYLFVVIDACSRKIIGFDINSGGEDRFMVMNAIKMAIMITKHIPFEIVSDNFSANKTDEIKNLQSELQKFGVQWRFAKVGNAQDKSYVERFNGTFQSMEQSLLEEYIGEGITSKRKNGRIDPEFVKEVMKKKGILPMEKMQDFIAGLICIYNDKQISNRPSPNEAERNLAIDKAQPLDFVNIARLFWSKTEATVKRGQITIFRNNVRFEYEIWDKELSLKYQDRKVIVRYDEKSAETISIFDLHTDEFIKDCRLKIKGYASNAEVPEGMEDIYIKAHSRKKSVSAYIANQTKEIIEKGLQKVEKTLETFDAISALDLNKHHLNAKESLEMLEIYANFQNRPIHSLNDYQTVANNGIPTNPNATKAKKKSNEFSIKSTKKTLQPYVGEAPQI